MRKFWCFEEEELGLRFYTTLLIIGWTLVVAISILWRINQESYFTVHLAREIAGSHLDKDLILRDWNIKHGFVYAPVTPDHQPNPYLKIPEREIVTPSGKTLTAINSSAMIRQVYELAGKKISYQGHLTSLKPLRPENAPDAWEQEALRRMVDGAKEVNGVIDQNGEPYFRLMRPLIATERCLACHANAGYTPGQVAGGISVTLPITSVAGTWQKTRFAVVMAHGFLWLVGLLGLAFGARQLDKKVQAKVEVEKALRRSEGSYRLLVQTIPALVYRGYLDGRMDFVDDKVEQLTGYPKELFDTGQIKWLDLLLPEDHPRCKEIFMQALKGDGAYCREYRLKRLDRKIIWVAEQSQIVFDDQRQVEFVSGVILDITLRKEMEQSLQESERFWKTLLEAVGVGLMVIDRVNGRVTEVNPQAVAMSGYSREQLIGQERQRFFICPLQQELTPNKSGKVENCSEGKLVKSDGSLMPIMKRVAPLQIGEMQYVLVSFVDLTDQRRAENALTQANKDLQAAMAEVGQTNKEMGLLSKMVELLQICHIPGEAYPIIGQYSQELFPGISGAFYLLNASHNYLNLVYQWGQPAVGEQVFGPQDCWALRQGRLYLCGAHSSASFNPKCHHIPADLTGSHLCVPLMAQGETLGLLYLEKLLPREGAIRISRSGLDFSKPEQKLARNLAENISLSLANLKLRESLRHQAIRDVLTGLFNRRYLQETLGREIHRAQRQETSLGVVMLDVDNFKIFNDTYGHEAGDRLLAGLGRYLQNSIRAEDIACRYGGEEFTLILPDITPEVLLERTETIREGVKNLEVNHQGKVLAGVTISLGLSYFPVHGIEPEILLQTADAALYQAKRSGRNRVVMAGSQLDGSNEIAAA